MRAVSHNPKFAKKVGVPQKVGKDFEAADTRAKKPKRKAKAKAKPKAAPSPINYSTGLMRRTPFKA